MAVNALGLPLLLQASSTQLQDLIGGLQPGDTMRGRLVELLPNEKAVLNLQGQNVVAQLPSGRSFQRGDILTLQVSQASAPEPGKPASLQLRLLPPAPEAPSALPPSAPALPAQAQMEQALSAARLPVNNLTLSVAQTLASLGAPLDSASLNAAVQATLALLNNETAPAPAAAPQTPLQAPVLQQTLRESLALLKVAAQLSPSSQSSVLLQQAAREIEQALVPVPTGAGQTAGTAAPAPAAPTGQPLAAASVPAAAPPPAAVAPAPAPPQAPSSPTAPGLQAPPPALPSASQLAQSIQQAVAQLAAAPSPAQAQALNQLLAQAGQAAPTPAPVAPSNAKSAQASVPVYSAPTVAVPTVTLNALPPLAPLNLPALPAQREAVAQWLGQVRQESGPLDTAKLAQSAQVLADQLADPAQPASQKLVDAVVAQAPNANPKAALQAARQALLDIAGHFSSLASSQPARSLPNASAVQAEVDSLGLPTPRLALSSLPAETVAEAVAWLQARELPPQRPLVEAVATWIAQDKAILPPAEKAVQTLQSLPPQVMEELPALKSAFDDAARALQSSAFKPEEQGLAQRLQQWAKDQGLTLENSLAKALLVPDAPASAKDGAQAAAKADAPPLRPALMRLEHELQQALRSPSAAQPEVAAKIDQALQDLQASTRSLNALPLQAQAAPAFDTVHLPLPVWMNGQVGAGNLSVTWRQGRERGLDEKDPVNVAVALKTESLGEVKVLLQVWKNAASARVIAETPEASAFLKTGAADLREGFNTRTPFQLQALDFESAEAGAPAPDSGPDAPRGGLSLSA